MGTGESVPHGRKRIPLGVQWVSRPVDKGEGAGAMHEWFHCGIAHDHHCSAPVSQSASQPVSQSSAKALLCLVLGVLLTACGGGGNGGNAGNPPVRSTPTPPGTPTGQSVSELEAARTREQSNLQAARTNLSQAQQRNASPTEIDQLRNRVTELENKVANLERQLGNRWKTVGLHMEWAGVV